MLLEAAGLTKSYRVGLVRKRLRPVIKGADLHLERGETLGVVGESGAGKSTLGFMLAGLLNADSGRVLLDGTDVRTAHGKERRRLRRRIQILFQHPETAFDPLWTLRRSMFEPFHAHGTPVSEEILDCQLSRVGLDRVVLDRRPSQLSGGELQRLAIARALSMQPDVVILDEPTSMLDALTQARIMRLLESIQKLTGLAYLLVSHDLPLVRLFCHRVLMLHEGLLKPFDTKLR